MSAYSARSYSIGEDYSTRSDGGGTFRGIGEVNRHDYGIAGPWLGLTVSKDFTTELDGPR